jgi:hypothetical protein
VISDYREPGNEISGALRIRGGERGREHRMKEEGRVQGVSKRSHRLKKMSCLRGQYRTLFVRSA